MTNNNSGTTAGAGGGVASAASAPPLTDVLEERLIDAEYKIWKKNTPFLYDFVLTHSLEWPSLTCQWLPNVRRAAGGASSSSAAAGGAGSAEEHNLLLGTHTTGEQNYLMVASCSLPRDEEVIDDKDDGDDDNDGDKKRSAVAAGGENSNNNNNNNSKKPPPQYDEEKRELGGFGHAANNVGKIEIKMKVKHEGEVNRARFMPQNRFVVATRGPSPEVYVFDLTKHPSFPQADAPFAPQGVCVGHEKEGYSMVWSPHQEGLLATGSEDATVKLWDVKSCYASKSKPGEQIKPTRSFSGHTDTVEDVDWHPKDANMIGSVGDDKSIFLWDARNSEKEIHVVKNGHEDDINCIAFNPKDEHLFATGSADRTVAVWDVRNLKSRVHSLVSHTDQVYMVQWAPFNETILGSCSADRRVAIWDLSRIGMEQSAEDAEDGPPELLFLHGGHTAKVSDFCWNSNTEWTIASVAEDNVLQVWNMAEEVYARDDEEEMSSGAGEDGLLGEDELEG